MGSGKTAIDSIIVRDHMLNNPGAHVIAVSGNEDQLKRAIRPNVEKHFHDKLFKKKTEKE